MVTVAVKDSLDDAERRQVLRLADAVEQHVGAPPLNDDARLHLAAADSGFVHLLAQDGRDLVGYGQLRDSAVEVAALAPAVGPLLDEAEQLSGDADLAVWAHGRHSDVTPAAEARGYQRRRVLWQLRRPLTDLPWAAMPAGVSVRAFVVGQDEDAWLAVNAAAFASHAEQGRWTRVDLASREAEPWFDPAGFLLAEREGELVGYHWTKVHPTAGAADGVLGEVYVLGVAPEAQGMGLGPALLRAGLRYLADRGCTDVLLYVDDDNPGAMRLYERSGFERADVDMQYVRVGILAAG